MDRGRERKRTRAGFLASALVVLLSSSLIATPQAMSWFCAWVNVSVATQAMLEVEEDMKEESARWLDEGSGSRFAAVPEHAQHPSPTDDAALPTRHAQVAVPPPEAC